jgi:hypothetical protein
MKPLRITEYYAWQTKSIEVATMGSFTGKVFLEMKQISAKVIATDGSRGPDFKAVDVTRQHECGIQAIKNRKR